MNAGLTRGVICGMAVALAAAPAAADDPGERVPQSIVAQIYLAGDASNALLSRYQKLRRQGTVQAGTPLSATVRDDVASYSVSLGVPGMQNVQSVSTVRSAGTVSKQQATRSLVTGANTLSPNQTRAGIDALQYVQDHPSAQARLTAATTRGDYVVQIVDRGRYVFVSVVYVAEVTVIGFDACNTARMFRYDPTTDSFAETAYHCP